MSESELQLEYNSELMKKYHILLQLQTKDNKFFSIVRDLDLTENEIFDLTDLPILHNEIVKTIETLVDSCMVLNRRINIHRYILCILLVSQLIIGVLTFYLLTAS